MLAPEEDISRNDPPRSRLPSMPANGFRLATQRFVAPFRRLAFEIFRREDYLGHREFQVSASGIEVCVSHTTGAPLGKAFPIPAASELGPATTLAHPAH